MRSNSLEKARAARKITIKQGFCSAQGRSQIAKNLAETWAGQSSRDRGDAWAIGVRLEQDYALLAAAIARLAGESYPSVIVHSEGVTLVMGQYSAEGGSWIEAALDLLKQVMIAETGSASEFGEDLIGGPQPALDGELHG
jgi:hypothetical protein